MQATIKCFYLETPHIDHDEIQKILREEVDSIFLVDKVAILRGKMSTRAYSDLAKFLDLHVMCYPRSSGQLEDVLISGAVSVVIPPSLPFEIMQQMSWLTEEIVLPFSTQEKASEFEKVGGSKYLTRGSRPTKYSSLYYVGEAQQGDHVIELKEFPDEMNNPSIF